MLSRSSALVKNWTSATSMKMVCRLVAELAKGYRGAAAGLSEAPPASASIKGLSLDGRCSTQEKNVPRFGRSFSTWGSA